MESFHTITRGSVSADANRVTVKLTFELLDIKMSPHSRKTLS